MRETPQEYTQRILSNIGDDDPWDVLASTASRLRQLVEGRPEGMLRRKPARNRWSIVEILAHLADCEVVTGWRLRSILASSGTALQPFDQNRWADVFTYEQISPDDSLELFDANRRGNLRLLRSVDPALHENFGIHEERGRESVPHLIRLYAGHDLNHLRQVEALLGQSV
ncbi:MAG: DinB family protein [Vicinamibacteraceae bacterium]